MSTIKATHVFTSESVSEGHPDKVCDQISDAILDACLAQDPDSRVACETLATTNLVVLSGEITTKAKLAWANIAREVIADIGYDDDSLGFSADMAQILIAIHKQSPDISQGVTAETSTTREQGAGDQGMMFGFACNETEAFLPAPLYYARRIMKRFADFRKELQTLPPAKRYLKPDAKAQLSFTYENGMPVAINNIVVSHQHSEDYPRELLEQLVRKVVSDVIPEQFITPATKFYVNPTGKFVIGGPTGDTGLTGRKIIVDTYGGMGRHGGGAFSGKDPSKVDRSAAYMARYVVKNIVAAGLADCCELQVAYAIGRPEPLSINVNTFGTGKVEDEKIAEVVANGDIFDFRPAKIIEHLQLKYPKGWSYRQAARYGHFGDMSFPWERLDKIDELKHVFSIR
ncbi:MAG: methionine adenosyltransferase [Victivallales bacterium]|nr:methionine adenosyltransferase [Victivallales bacterium]